MQIKLGNKELEDIREYALSAFKNTHNIEIEPHLFMIACLLEGLVAEAARQGKFLTIELPKREFADTIEDL